MAVEDDLVIHDAESGRCQLLKTLDAFLKIKHSLARTAVKVMMVALIGSLVAGRLSGDFNAAYVPGLHQGFQGAIYCCDTERGDAL